MYKRIFGALSLATAATLAPIAHAQTTLEFPTWQAEEPGVSTWWTSLTESCGCACRVAARAALPRRQHCATE